MISEFTVGLVQINNGYSGQYYLPYSVGLLQAYAERNLSAPERYVFLPMLYRRDPIGESVQKLLSARIVGFSLYVWNAQITLAIAKELKRQNSQVLIVFGGPQVPDNAEVFLRKNTFIDVACHGEGEKTFTAILEDLDCWRSLPSLSYIEEGVFVANPRSARITNLDELPSPYLEGTFDELMHTNPGSKWNATWETTRGCPFRCSFCDWGSATAGKLMKLGPERLDAEIEWFALHHIDFVFGTDANFGILKERDIAIAQKLAETKLATGFPRAFTVSNTKNGTEWSFKAQKILSDSGLNTGVTLSMQSMDPGTLVAIKRDNIHLDGPKGFKELQRQFTLAGIQTSTDLVLGLPGETYRSFSEGVSELITNGQHNRILFFNCSILPNAEMGDPAYQERYGMKTVVSRIIAIHGDLNNREDVVTELQELVVSTKSLPPPEWVRVRAFAYMTAFLHFDKIFQIPMVVMHEITGLSYWELIEIFSEAHFGSPEEFPILTKIRNFFLGKAQDIQNGAEEFCRAPQWLDLWWPTDEYMLIDLATSGLLPRFYEEARRAFEKVLNERGLERYCEAIREAIFLNERMFKMPFQTKDRMVELSYNLWDYYFASISGRPIELKEASSTFAIDCTTETWDSWDTWYRQVVWYGSKRGAFFYGITSASELAAHW